MRQTLLLAAAMLAIVTILRTSALADELKGGSDVEAKRAWARFADPKTPEPDAGQAALGLVGRRNPPEAAALLRIADDPRFGDVRRRRAVLLFFCLHVRAGETLGRLAADLAAGREWLGREQIRAIVAQGGKTPVDMKPGSVFWIQLRLPGEDTSTVYLRVEGRPREERFAAALRGEVDAELADTKILQIGYSLSDDLDKQMVAPRTTEERGLLPKACNVGEPPNVNSNGRRR